MENLQTQGHMQSRLGGGQIVAQNKKMTEYEFELKFKLSDEEDPEQYLDALFEAGCDDALVGLGKVGFIGMDFSREAENVHLAISTALRDVREAIPHARQKEFNVW